MLLLVFLWNNSNLTLKTEVFFREKASLLKRTTFFKNFSKKTIGPDDVLLVNTGTSGKLIHPEGDEDNLVWITDRKKLAEFITALNSLPGNKIILCDLLFEESTEDDSTLRVAINATQNIFFPTSPDLNTPPLLRHLPGGYTNYTVTTAWGQLSSTFNKFKLSLNDSLKSLPLLIAERFYAEPFQCSCGLLHNDYGFFFNSVYLDPVLREYNLVDTLNRSTKIYSMADLLFLRSSQDDSEWSKYAKPIIIIGDFDKDLHPSGTGVSSGPVILFNLFASIINRENAVTPLWLLYIFCSFFFITHTIFFLEAPGWVRKLHRFLRRQIGKLGDRLLINFFWLWLSAFFSYLLFNSSIEIIVLTLWLTFAGYVRDSWRRFQRVKSRTDLEKHHKLKYAFFDYITNKKV